jgi:hypothetical protein
MDPLEGAVVLGAAIAAVLVGRRVLRKGSSPGRAVAEKGGHAAGAVGHAVGSFGHAAASATEQVVTGAGKVAASGIGAAIDAPGAVIDRVRHRDEQPAPAHGADGTDTAGDEAGATPTGEEQRADTE